MKWGSLTSKVVPLFDRWCRSADVRGRGSGRDEIFRSDATSDAINFFDSKDTKCLINREFVDQLCLGRDIGRGGFGSFWMRTRKV